MAEDRVAAEGGSQTEAEEILADDCVLIVGGGPVGLLTAVVLAFYGVPSVILERNLETTRWPKMDLTNARSMEFFRKLNLAEELRRQGVPLETPYDVLMSTGLGSAAPLTAWVHPSVDKFREAIKSRNDGTQPLEPYQRLSQEVFEAWMKRKCEADPLIDVRFGWRLDAIAETVEGVEAEICRPCGTELRTRRIKARYAVACDGASSRCRRSLGIPLDGGPVPGSFLLIHFKSRDSKKLFKQGVFWHLFILKNGEFGGAVISQDSHEIFTVHVPIPSGTDPATISSEEAVYKLLGGLGEPYRISIDEILVRSTYRPSIAVSRSFSGPKMRVFLAGDSAHQNVPTGGYGMNTGLGDAFDISWKLAAVIKGWGRQGLLYSYEQERRPVAITNVERSGVHMSVHMQAVAFLADASPSELKMEGSDERRRLKEQVHMHYQANDGENTDLGIEMGYRYRSEIIAFPNGRADRDEVQPPWDAHTYTPTTWPGGRPPNIFLTDGSAIFDKFGKEFTLMEFSTSAGLADRESGGQLLLDAAQACGVPMSHVNIHDEDQAAKLWERPLVLIRPDGHVAWRGDPIKDTTQASRIVETAVGYHYAAVDSDSMHSTDKIPAAFTMTGASVTTQIDDYKLENMGEFQK